MSAAPVRRVGVAFTGDPRDPRSWSGTPAGIVGGIEALGVEVVPISVLPAGRWHAAVRDLLAATQLLRFRGSWRSRVDQSRNVATHLRTMSRVRSAVAAARLKGARVEGVVQIGSGYRVPGRYVTFEDMTVRQALRNPLTRYNELSSRQARSRVRQQARLYTDAERVCFATSWPAASATGEYGLEDDHVRVVGIGANLKPARAERDWQRPTYLFIGKQWEVKGGPTLIAAFREVRRVHAGAQLLVVGGVSVDEAGVECLGYVDLSTAEGRAEMQAAWDRATCLVQPSIFEAAGLVFCEAKYAGIPAIGSANGGAANVIGEDGVVVDPGRVHVLVQAMLRFAEPTLAAKVGAAAHAHASRNSWENVARALVSALANGDEQLTSTDREDLHR